MGNRFADQFFEKKPGPFYGSSFIAGSTGQLLAEADPSTETIITAELDLERHKVDRSAWGFFRDRRPEMYQALMTLDGVVETP
jgi:N-carbamoylputrescine amidase